MSEAEVICEVRYYIDQDGMEEFYAYARTWVMLIERYGGRHEGYLVSRQAPVGATMSFPGVGENGPDLIAVARFAFPDETAYLQYRDEVRKDPDGIKANSLYGNNPPFRRYERIFLERLI